MAFFNSWNFGKYACCFTDMVEGPKSLKTEARNNETESSAQWGGGMFSSQQWYPDRDFSALQACPSLRESLGCKYTCYPKRTDSAFYAFLALFNSHLSNETAGLNKASTLEDKRACVKDSMKLLEQVDPLTRRQATDLLESLARFCDCALVAAAAIIGGVIAQEIRKFCTKKDMPLGNWIVLNCDKSEVVQTTIP